MNFFEHQDQARRKTGMLVGLFVVAVAGLIVGTYVLIMSLYLGGLEQASQQREMLINQFGPDTTGDQIFLLVVALAVFSGCWRRKPLQNRTAFWRRRTPGPFSRRPPPLE